MDLATTIVLNDCVSSYVADPPMTQLAFWVEASDTKHSESCRIIESDRRTSLKRSVKRVDPTDDPLTMVMMVLKKWFRSLVANHARVTVPRQLYLHSKSTVCT